jgi:hypothetical protein
MRCNDRRRDHRRHNMRDRLRCDRRSGNQTKL